MHKVFPLSALTALFLVACGKEKDAEHYFNNPNELREAITQCETKLDGGTEKHNEIFKMEINNDADLETLKQQVNQAIAEVEQLKQDKMCNEVMVATVAVQIDNLKRAQLEYSNILEQTGDEIIEEYRKKMELIEKRYQEKLAYQAKEKEYEGLSLSEVAEKFHTGDCLKDDSVDCKVLTDLWNKGKKEYQEEIAEKILQSSPEEVLSVYKEIRDHLNEETLRYCGENSWYPPKGGVCEFYKSINSNFSSASNTSSPIVLFYAEHTKELVKEYNECREKLSGHSMYSKKWTEIKNEFPCDILDTVAYTVTGGERGFQNYYTPAK